jgi:DNA-binding NtrC family response regulator
MNETIFVVEDHEKIRANLVSRLEDLEYKVTGYADAESAAEELKKPGDMLPDLMLLDVRLPGMSGIELIRHLMELERLPPTIMISGEATISETVEALRMGVYDFLEKPVSKARLTRSVRNCLDHHALMRRVQHLEERLEPSRTLMLGDSPAMLKLKSQIAKIGPTEGRVLIRGESGTGKELVAAMIHEHSNRSRRPLVKVNCAAIPANLIESELFGHARGAFTDARSDKAGLFEVADGGTLFLDEIGDMDISLQARLLRVLEDGKVRRIGENREREVNVRIIAATNSDLEKSIEEGRFREDLYFRLSTLPLEILPLRDRPEDVPLLVSYFTKRYCEQNSFEEKHFAEETWRVLKNYAWPGNVRELKNLCERLVILAGNPVKLEHLPRMIQHNTTSNFHVNGQTGIEFPDEDLPLRDFKAMVEREYIERTIKKMDGNITQAANMLGIQRTYLYQKMASLGIDKVEA